MPDGVVFLCRKPVSLEALPRFLDRNADALVSSPSGLVDLGLDPVEGRLGVGSSLGLPHGHPVTGYLVRHSQGFESRKEIELYIFLFIYIFNRYIIG